MIYISKDLVEQIVEHSKREFPNEACGILSGSQGMVKKVYEMTNTDKSPQTFFMDAREQIKVLKGIRSTGQEMLGIYHSHTASEAYPSGRDVELAHYSDASYVIVSLKNKDNLKIRSFKIKEGKITEEEIKIV
ncbi:MAG: M67 family metallopeptidase [Candidatus Omnitrophica bacterium]|nr:M67 family metallopeptidase [Candidatus Omnitrophota bacterium]